MHFFEHTKSLIHQLQGVLDQLQPDQYCQKLTVLHGSSVGQHVRHIIEFFEELEKDIKPALSTTTTGNVDYCWKPIKPPLLPTCASS